MKAPANLKQRTFTSIALIAAMIGILVGDDYYRPHAPFLLTCIAILQCLAAIELAYLLPKPKPDRRLVIAALLGMTIMFWLAIFILPATPKTGIAVSMAYAFCIVVAVIALTVFVELLRYDGSGDSTFRAGNAVLSLMYIGVPSIFILLIRTLKDNSTLALAAMIFVPKLGDVGAYLTGSLFGRHKLTPTLSPKKTWEGFAGGMAVSVLVAIAFNFIGPEPLFKKGVPEAGAFGIVVGLAGVFGDLFASMLKRDAGVKDASKSIPGFGGVLDVVDSVLFAAPAAYLFFVL